MKGSAPRPCLPIVLRHFPVILIADYASSKYWAALVMATSVRIEQLWMTWRSFNLLRLFSSYCVCRRTWSVWSGSNHCLRRSNQSRRNVVKHNMWTRHACEHHYCGDVGVDQNRPSHPCPQVTSTGKGGSKVLKHGWQGRTVTTAGCRCGDPSKHTVTLARRACLWLKHLCEWCVGVSSLCHEALHRTCQKADGTDDVSKVGLVGKCFFWAWNLCMHLSEWHRWLSCDFEQGSHLLEVYALEIQALGIQHSLEDLVFHVFAGQLLPHISTFWIFVSWLVQMCTLTKNSIRMKEQNAVSQSLPVSNLQFDTFVRKIERLPGDLPKDHQPHIGQPVCVVSNSNWIWNCFGSGHCRSTKYCGHSRKRWQDVHEWEKMGGTFVHSEAQKDVCHLCPVVVSRSFCKSTSHMYQIHVYVHIATHSHTYMLTVSYSM